MPRAVLGLDVALGTTVGGRGASGNRADSLDVDDVLPWW